MQVVPRNKYTLTLSPEHEPIVVVNSGEPFRVECPAAAGGVLDENGEPSEKTESANPLAGPVLVREIRPGETLCVEIKRIEPVGYGKSGKVIYKPVSRRLEFLDGLSVPASPSIGGMGVSPKLPTDATDNMTCGPHGGNLDCKDFAAGAFIFFRARVTGANLGFGDVHWAMGDGELNGTGVEGAADLEIVVHGADAPAVEWPWLVRDGLLMTMGAAGNLRIAQRIAYEEMVSFCRARFGLERTEVQGRITVAGDLKICQSVCEKITVRLSLPLDLLGVNQRKFLDETLR